MGVVRARSGVARARLPGRVGGGAGGTGASSLRVPRASRQLGRLGERLDASTTASCGRRRSGIANAATAPRPTTTAPTATAVFIPSENACRALVAAGAREDRGEHRDAEDTAELADRVVGPGRLALLVGADGGEHDIRDGAKKSAMPTPATMNGAISCEYETVGVDTGAIQASAIACSVRPVPMIRFGLIRSESAPAIGAMNIGASVHGRIRSPEPSGE